MNVEKTFKYGGLLCLSAVGRGGVPVDIVVKGGDLKLYIRNKYICTLLSTGNHTEEVTSLLLEKIAFNPDTVIALANIGEVRYSSEYHTLEAKISNDVTVQLGQETVCRVKNNENFTITNGKVIYINGASGANPLAKLATTADQDVAQRTFAVATEDLIKNELGFVTTEGVVHNVNTNGIPEGTLLWLDTNGNFTGVQPVAPTPKVSIGICLRESATVGVIYVKIRAIPRLSRLSDVYFPGTIADGQVARWNAVTQRFEFVTVSEGSTLVKSTPERGLAIKMVNGTGVPSVKGTVVSASTTADNKFILQSNEFDSIGIVYESGIADGSECWVIISGIAEVLLKDGTATTHGQIAIAADTDGRFIAIDVPSSNPVIAEHFKEVGHVLESKASGTNVLVKCIIHFN